MRTFHRQAGLSMISIIFVLALVFVVVALTVKLAPLTVEDLNELDDWLQGTIRRRGDETRGGISGLSRTIGGMLMSMTGFGDKTVRAKTPKFRPEEIPQRPLLMEVPEERRDLEAREDTLNTGRGGGARN